MFTYNAVTKEITMNFASQAITDCLSAAYVYDINRAPSTSLIIRQLTKSPLDGNRLNVREKGESWSTPI